MTNLNRSLEKQKRLTLSDKAAFNALIDKLLSPTFQQEGIHLFVSLYTTSLLALSFPTALVVFIFSCSYLRWGMNLPHSTHLPSDHAVRQTFAQPADACAPSTTMPSPL